LSFLHYEVQDGAKRIELQYSEDERGVITKEEHQQISDFVALQWDVIQVDSFSEEEYLA